MNALTYMAFAAVFLACTVGFLGLAVVAWLGWLLGLLWMAALAPFVLLILWRVHAIFSR